MSGSFYSNPCCNGAGGYSGPASIGDFDIGAAANILSRGTDHEFDPAGLDHPACPRAIQRCLIGRECEAHCVCIPCRNVHAREPSQLPLRPGNARHRIAHIELNHFDLLGDFQISETPNAPVFGIARRADLQLGSMLKLPVEMRTATPQCLELQADHDAADLLLEAYSTEGWEDLRCKITAISGMMMLIERADAQYNEASLTHPKAATRIFQLLGHVTEMPLIRAQVKAKQAGAKAVDPDDIPSADEIQAFGRAVTLPCFFDAVYLARVVEADTIRADLGDPADFFQDIATAKLATPDQLSQLKTSGAREWAKLVLINDRLKPLQAGQYEATR